MKRVSSNGWPMPFQRKYFWSESVLDAVRVHEDGELLRLDRLPHRAEFLLAQILAAAIGRKVRDAELQLLDRVVEFLHRERHVLQRQGEAADEAVGVCAHPKRDASRWRGG